MSKWRKRPVIIEAVLVSDLNDNQPEWASEAWCKGTWSWNWQPRKGIYIETNEGTMYGAETDYLIQGVAGELYPCKPDIFAATYEAVE